MQCYTVFWKSFKLKWSNALLYVCTPTFSMAILVCYYEYNLENAFATINRALA